MRTETRIGYMIRNYAHLRGLTHRQLAGKLDISERVLSARLKNPDAWRLTELVAVFDVLDIPEEERCI